MGRFTGPAAPSSVSTAVEPSPTVGSCGPRNAVSSIRALAVIGAWALLRATRVIVNMVVIVVLGVALVPAFWRGEPSSVLVVQAEGLGLAELARALAVDLPAPESTLPVRALPVFGVAWSLYLLGLAGVWAAALRAMARERFGWIVSAPALAGAVVFVFAPAAFTAATS